MKTFDIDMFSLLQKKNFTKDEAQEFVQLLNEKQEDSSVKLKEIFLTKEDKIDLIKQMHTDKVDLVNRMDTHFKWLAGIIIATIGLAVTLLKLSFH